MRYRKTEGMRVEGEREGEGGSKKRNEEGREGGRVFTGYGTRRLSNYPRLFSLHLLAVRSEMDLLEFRSDKSDYCQGRFFLAYG